MLKKLEQLPHVEAVVPAIYDRGFVEIEGNSQPTDVTAIRPNDEPCKRRLLAGRLFDSPAERAAIVSELLLYRLGLLDEENISSALGKHLRLEFHPRSSPAGFALYLSHADNSEPSHAETIALDKLRQQLAGSLEKFELTADDLATLRKVLDASPQTAPEPVTLELPIVGVVRLMNDQEEQNWDPLRADADVILPSQTAADLELSMPTASARGNSLGRVTVVVDRDENIKPVVRANPRAWFGRKLGVGICRSAAADVFADFRRHDLRRRGGAVGGGAGHCQHDAHGNTNVAEMNDQPMTIAKSTFSPTSSAFR